MFAVIVSEKGGGTERHEFHEKHEVTIGRVQGNDIILAKGNVSKKHSRLILKDGRFIVVDLKSTNGTYVNGRKVTSPLVVKPSDKIFIGDFTISVEGSEAGSQVAVPAPVSPVTPEPLPPVAAAPTGAALPPPAPPAPPVPVPVVAAPAPLAPPPAPKLAAPKSPLPPPPGTESNKPQPKTWEPPRREAERGRGTSPQAPAHEPSRPAQTRHTAGVGAWADAVGDRHLRALMARLENDLDLNDVSADAMRDESRWTDAERSAERAVRAAIADGALDDSDHAGLVAAAVREAVGLGVLESLLADERVREIVVSSPAHVAADFGEGLEQVAGAFSDGRMLMTILARLASQAGAYLDRSTQLHELTLPSGAVATILLPPLASSGPVVEIRRVHAPPTLDDLVASHALSTESRSAILRAIAARDSIAVVGPSGSGVTTMLAAILGAIVPDERLVLASGLRDLRPDRPNAVLLVAGPGGQHPPLREVVSQAARLRSDRLVVDGVGSDELAVTLARFAGRPGGDLVGIRARTGEKVLATLRRLVTQGGVPEAEVDPLIESGLGFVVELDADHGLRRVKRVHELRRSASGRLEAGDGPSA